MSAAGTGRSGGGLPDFYDPAQIAEWDYTADLQAVYAAGAEAPLPAAAADGRRVVLLLVDHQRDFVHPRGALYVGGRSGDGAQQDTRRIVELIHLQGARITEIVATLDTHHPEQIFFQRFWIDREGRRPAPFTQIRHEELRAGRWLPDPEMIRHLPPGESYAWAVRQVEHYAATLESEGRHALTIWPDHCLEGTPGHGLAGALEAAIAWHSGRRGAAPVMLRKGDDTWTESYSVFRPEAPTAWDGRRLAQGNRAAMQSLLDRADEILVAGEAASHCVLWSVNDLVSARGPEAASKITILTDCMSSVVTLDADGRPIPGLDFTSAAEAGFAAWKDAGVKLTTSAEW